MKTFIPDSYKLSYILETEKKTFKQFILQSAELSLLPDTIKLEINNGYNTISGANLLLRIRNATNWQKCSIAGLRPINGAKGFYYSDLIVEGKKSLIVVKLDDNRIQIRVCKQFYPNTPPDRQRITQFIALHF